MLTLLCLVGAQPISAGILFHFLITSEFKSLCMYGMEEFLSLSVLASCTWNFSLDVVIIDY